MGYWRLGDLCKVYEQFANDFIVSCTIDTEAWLKRDTSDQHPPFEAENPFHPLLCFTILRKLCWTKTRPCIAQRKSSLLSFSRWGTLHFNVYESWRLLLFSSFINTAWEVWRASAWYSTNAVSDAWRMIEYPSSRTEISQWSESASVGVDLRQEVGTGHKIVLHIEHSSDMSAALRMNL